MKYLLLLILPLLSSAVITGYPATMNVTSVSNFYSLNLKKSEIKESDKEDSVVCLDEKLKAILLKGFIKAPRDSFPIQVAAFKNKSNAERFFMSIKNLSGIKVKMIVEDDFYKVRISRFPEVAKSETNDTAIFRAETDIEQRVPVTDKLIADSSNYNIITLRATTVFYTSGIIDDNVSAKKKIILPGDNNPWYKRIKYFGESFALVKALIITILLSVFTMITLLIVILMNRRRMENEEKLHQYLTERYQSLIVDFLYGSATPDEFRSIASDNYSRQVLIDQMIDVSVNLKGEESEKLIELYKYLGLDKDSLARVRDFRWHKKIKGFRELAHMNIKDANDAIHKALNSSNEILRMEAQIALVRLSENGHFEFLSQLKRPFSLWEQITLHDLIIQHNIPVPPFKKWLASANYTVVIFALRMIREFKQDEAEEEIKNSLLHKSPEVRLLAAQVAGDLKLSSTLGIMKRMYKNQDYKTCLEIVKSMGKMADTSMLGFLKLVLDKEDDVQLQIEATKSIEKMGEEGVKALVKIMKSEYKNYNIIVRHVLDKRIN